MAGRKRDDYKTIDGLKRTHRLVFSFLFSFLSLFPCRSQITIYLKEKCKEFAKPARVKEIIKKYSNFVNFPIKVRQTHLLNPLGFFPFPSLPSPPMQARGARLSRVSLFLGPLDAAIHTLISSHLSFPFLSVFVFIR